ncbi:MAG: phosphotransferase enzyme family protein [Christensenellales bacterium]|jgi:aminoglycoside phosphotransferase (APT) family kinase protein
MVYNEIKHILPHFQFQGTYANAVELTSGNINNTYKLTYQQGDVTNFYTLQHINKYVFRYPAEVLRNIELVTGHLTQAYERMRLDPARHVLALIPVKGGEYLHQDNEGSFWRAYRFISGATAYDAPKKAAHLFETGRAFGEFQKLLCDFPADKLAATIPDFHNTSRRFYTFVASIAADKAGRACKVEDEIEFMFDKRTLMNRIVKKLDAGEIPIRVTHNDTKINNVLIDDETDRATCVIDLDTVMPGSSLYDFGDAIRFCASTAAEDEEDLSKISLDIDRFRLFTEGFLSEVNGFLTEEELRNLPLGVLVITCELAMRFLTDYIDGDLYFKVRSPEHNLIRARAQIRLFQDMEEKCGEMQRIVDELMR